MNKKNIIIIIMFIILFSIISFLVINKIVLTDTNDKNNIKNDKKGTYTINIICDKDKINIEESINCKLIGNSSDLISMFEGKLINSSNLKITNIKKNSMWTVGVDDPNIQLISDGIKGSFEIISFNVKGIEKGDGIIKINRLNGNLGFTNKKMNKIRLNEIKKSIIVE